MSEVLWTPSPERIGRATLTAYADWLAVNHGVETDDYAGLWRWSTENPGAFWASVAQYFDLRFSQPPTRALGSVAMPGAEWFPGAELNFAEHVLAGRDPASPAIHHASELRALSSWTWGRLSAETQRIQAGLQALGVGRGDRVAAYLPNIPETVAALLATASLGAIWSSAAPEFGARTVIDRFSQIEPKVLLGIDGYRYGGRNFDASATVAQIAAEVPSAPTVVRLGYLDGSGWGPEIPGRPGGILEPTVENPGITFEPVPFDHPLWVLYSSGTTSLPKPIVHSQGGILLEHTKLMHLHLDAHAGDNVFWFTTTGWMMWNFLVGVLLTDAAIVLFDGNPGYPDLGTLWDLAAQASITTFGTSAAYINSCMKAQVEPTRGRDLSALKAVGSTGSPLSPDGFRWVYDHLDEDIWLFSTSGGTDVCTAFVGGVPTLPVREGELQARALGAAVEAWDPDGHPLVGQMGELVISVPMPSMPIYFWNDPDGERLRDSYFSTYPGVWRHGDWIEITSTGGAIMHGRSDSTINRGGVRIGTAEIYAAVLGLDAVTDALAIELPARDGESRIELFLVLMPGRELDGELTAQIRARIREDCSPRHLPDRLVAVPEVPRTLSGKLLEVPVKRILSGEPPERVASRDSLANPQSLDVFIEIARAALGGTLPDGG